MIFADVIKVILKGGGGRVVPTGETAVNGGKGRTVCKSRLEPHRQGSPVATRTKPDDTSVPNSQPPELWEARSRLL